MSRSLRRGYCGSGGCSYAGYPMAAGQTGRIDVESTARFGIDDAEISMLISVAEIDLGPSDSRSALSRPELTP